MSVGHPEVGWISENDLEYNLKQKINLTGGKLLTYKNTVTLSAASVYAMIGIPTFLASTDTLWVGCNTALLYEGVHYTVSGDSAYIIKTNATPWVAGTVFYFVVLKNANAKALQEDGTLILDNSIPMLKILESYDIERKQNTEEQHVTDRISSTYSTNIPFRSGMTIDSVPLMQPLQNYLGEVEDGGYGGTINLEPSAYNIPDSAHGTRTNIDLVYVGALSLPTFIETICGVNFGSTTVVINAANYPTYNTNIAYDTFSGRIKDITSQPPSHHRG